MVKRNFILSITDYDSVTGGTFETDVLSYKKKLDVDMPNMVPDCTEDDIINAVKTAAKKNYIPKMVSLGFTETEAEEKFETIFAEEIVEPVVEEPVGGV